MEGAQVWQSPRGAYVVRGQPDEPYVYEIDETDEDEHSVDGDTKEDKLEGTP